MNITLKIQGISIDIDLRNLVKDLLVEALVSRLESKQQEQTALRNDSTQNAAVLVDNLAVMEAANFPLEGEGRALSVMQEPVALADTSTFYENEGRVTSMNTLRRRKTVTSRLARAARLVTYIDDVLQEDDVEIEDLVDGIFENSSSLLTNLAAAALSPSDRISIKDAIAGFLDENLQMLAGEEAAVTFADLLEPIETPVTYPSGYEQGADYYISPLAPLEDREQLIANIEAYQEGQTNPPFVVVNYSMDVSPESYLQRAPTGRPKGLAPDREYVIINYLNTPGSIEETIVSNNPEEALEATEGVPVYNENAQALIDALKSASGKQEDGFVSSAFILNNKYSYKGTVKLKDKETALRIEHWYYSGEHRINPLK